MYPSHLVAGLAAPPHLCVDTATWTEADWEVQQHPDDLEAAVTTSDTEMPRCGCPACTDGEVACRCLSFYHCGGCDCDGVVASVLARLGS